MLRDPPVNIQRMKLKWLLLAGFEVGCFACYNDGQSNMPRTVSSTAPLKRNVLHRRSPQPPPMQWQHFGHPQTADGPRPGAYSSFKEYWSRDLGPKVARASLSLESLIPTITNEEKPQKEREGAWKAAKKIATESPANVHEHMIDGHHLYSKGLEETKLYQSMYDRLAPVWLKAADLFRGVSLPFSHYRVSESQWQFTGLIILKESRHSSKWQRADETPARPQDRTSRSDQKDQMGKSFVPE